MAIALSDRIGCSTISFQHLTLEDALVEIGRLGFSQIDLGALPGVCDHVPAELGAATIARIASTVRASGLRVRSVNGDIGDLNRADADRRRRHEHLRSLLDVTAEVGACALVLPCGSLGHQPLTTLPTDLALVADELAGAAEIARTYGVEIWVESLHFLRLSWNRERAEALHAKLEGSGVRPILDLAHVIAAGDDLEALIRAWAERIAHVHVRDAVRGDFNRPFGSGDVDLAVAVRALDAVRYAGAFALELPASAYRDDATEALDDQAGRDKAAIVGRAAATLNAVLTARNPNEGDLP